MGLKKNNIYINTMEKILSFDVGIIHLAYCFLTKKEYIEEGNKKYKWDIMDWAIIDLADRADIKCTTCNKNASFNYNYGGLKHYCKVHSKTLQTKPMPYEDYFKALEKKQIGGCVYDIDGEICNKNCTIRENGNNKSCYCLPHAKKIYKDLETSMKLQKIKKSNIKELDFDDTRLKLVMELEKRKHLLEANVVVIENQPSFKNPRMKSISGILYDYYMIRGMVDKAITKSNIKRVKFMSPSNKIKLSTDDETQQLVKLKSTDESKAYKMTKSLAVKYATEMTKHLPEWLAKFNSHKKKDDLADAFLQGAYYFEMNVKLDDDKVYKKKDKKETKSKEPIIKIDTTNKTIEL